MLASPFMRRGLSLGSHELQPILGLGSRPFSTRPCQLPRAAWLRMEAVFGSVNLDLFPVFSFNGAGARAAKLKFSRKYQSNLKTNSAVGTTPKIGIRGDDYTARRRYRHSSRS
jgi:hypothetical protein